MSKYHARYFPAFLALFLLLMCCGCEFGTTVITDADSPDVVADTFFASLKKKDYVTCDGCLADNATIKVTNSTDSGFSDVLVDFYLDKLEFEPIGKAEITGVTAVKKVRISTPDKAEFFEWFKTNKFVLEKQYMKENNIVTIDHQNMEEVGKMLKYAVSAYSDSAKMTSTELELTFVLEGNRWLINGSTELVCAIYGGSSDEEN